MGIKKQTGTSFIDYVSKQILSVLFLKNLKKNNKKTYKVILKCFDLINQEILTYDKNYKKMQE